MKKQILTALGIAILGATSYAATFMNVKTKDGKNVEFDVNDVKEVVFVEEAAPAHTTPVSDHEYVDLGLPSGTLWATYNIGATKPEEYGDYFAWGETEPKEMYDWSTYKYTIARMDTDGDWEADTLTKYNYYGRYPGKRDNLETLLSEDDAATANWGSEWRMPTIQEEWELLDNCVYEWTEVGGVSGAKFIGSNGNSIFLPAAGYFVNSGVMSAGVGGFYWSSSLYKNEESWARYLLLYDDKHDSFYGPRCTGHSVRAVRAKK